MNNKIHYSRWKLPTRNWLVSNAIPNFHDNTHIGNISIYSWLIFQFLDISYFSLSVHSESREDKFPSNIRNAETYSQGLICNSTNSPKRTDPGQMAGPVRPLGAIRAKTRGRIEQDKRSRRQSSPVSSLDVILLIDIKGIPRGARRLPAGKRS